MNLYSKVMGTNMLKLFETHKNEICVNKALKAEKIREIKHLHEFDREVQCATWGYPTEGAYYRDASSSDSVMAIRIPTYCLHAEDDPIVANEAVPYAEIKRNPYVVLCATSGGGHLCWFEWGGGRWHTKPVSCLVMLHIVRFHANLVVGDRVSQRHGIERGFLQDQSAQTDGRWAAWWS